MRWYAVDPVRRGRQVVGDALDQAPLVGDAVSSPLYGAARSAGEIGQAGADAAASIDAAGTWMAVVTGVVLLLLVLPAYLPGRIAFVRNASAVTRALRTEEGVEDLLALRALVRQPVARLLETAPDAAQAWRARDATTLARLAAWERYDAGVGPRPERTRVV